MRAFAAGSALLLLSTLSCARQERAEAVVVLGLAEGFEVAEVAWEVGEIDFGAPGTSEYLLGGWSWPERGAGGFGYRWSNGEESALELYLAAPRPLPIRFRCQPFKRPGSPRQAVSLAVNGEPVGELELRSGWHEYQAEVPVSALRAGLNRLSLSYRHVVSPAELGGSKDRRRLAVAFDWMRFEGSTGIAPRADRELGDLVLPLGARVDYYLEVPPGARLTVGDVQRRGSEGALEADITAADSTQSGRLVLAPGGGSEIDLGVEGWARLRLSALASSAGGEGAWVLRNAVVRGPTPLGAPAELEREPAPDRPPNLILYVVDTLRADHLGAYGYGRPVSPRLDAFAAEAVLFERALAQSSWTLPAMASLFTGLEPQSHGATGKRDRLRARRSRRLPKLLQRGRFRHRRGGRQWLRLAHFRFRRGLR